MPSKKVRQDLDKRGAIIEILRTQVGALQTGENCYEIQAYWRGKLADQILALFPSEKEIRKDERERILEIIAEDFIAPVGNFYMDDEDRKRSFELWRAIKKQLLREQ